MDDSQPKDLPISKEGTCPVGFSPVCADNMKEVVCRYTNSGDGTICLSDQKPVCDGSSPTVRCE
jgi:hypothetical protein